MHQGMEKRKEKPCDENQEGTTPVPSVSTEKLWQQQEQALHCPSETQSLWGLSFPRHAIDKDTLQTD